MRRTLAILGLAALSCPLPATAYTAVPRWAQAVAVSTDALFIYGGKTDPYNTFSYTGAPSSNDVLFLSLSASWDPASPPWNLIGGSGNSSATAQGPDLAWHTMSTYAAGEQLIFGGSNSPNGASSTGNDSALVLDAFNRLMPTLTSENGSWAGEPQRRMRHAAATSGGKVYIIGGERADGSNNAFSDHWVFDPSGPSFTLMPTANAPPDVYGHAALVLSNGFIIVFGGFSQSRGILLSFDQIWLFDPSSGTWSTASVSSSNVPPGRVDFCAVVLSDGRILIHGGDVTSFQNTKSDGWILDTSQNPMVWSSVATLSQLGERKDHFCIAVGNQVVFGFGFGSNGPANASLSIFDVPSLTWTSSYSPMTTLPSQTTAPPSVTTGGVSSGASGTASGASASGTDAHHSGSSRSQSGTGTGLQPTSTSGADPASDGDANHNKTTAIAIGATLGVLALIAGTGAAAYYLRRRNSADSFSRIGGGDGDDDSPLSPTARGIPVLQDPTSMNEKGRRLFGLGAAAGLLGLGAARAQRVNPRERRDMLADEDRSFDWESGRWSGGRWSSRSSRSSRGGHLSRDVSGSSWSGSAASVRSRVSDAFVRALRLGPRVTRHAPRVPEWEKGESDPFSDELALMADEGAAERPRGGMSSSYNYTDPFADLDPDAEVLHDADAEDANMSLSMSGAGAAGVHAAPPHPALRTALPPTADFVPMSPLIEQASRGSFSSSSQAHSSGAGTLGHSHSSQDAVPHSPFGTVSSTSHSSALHSQTQSPRPSSILDAQQQQPATNIKRSNSWWARFADAPFLPMRRPSDGRDAARRMGFVDDFRDPNPPPRLRPIEEASLHKATSTSASVSASPDTPASSRRQGSGEQAEARLLGRGVHGKSMSSIQTANSETVERAGRMTIVQREGTSDSNTIATPATSPLADEFGVAGPSFVAARKRPLVVRSNPSEDSGVLDSDVEDAGRAHTRTPTGGTDTPLGTTVEDANISMSPQDLRQASLPPAPAGPRSPGGTSVAERVRMLERQERDKGVRYGLAPRASLFVANPDGERS